MLGRVDQPVNSFATILRDNAGPGGSSLMSIRTSNVTVGLAIAFGILALEAAPAARAARVPEPRDVAYPGTITLAVDVSDLDHRLFSVIERVPVQPGPITLLYPEWLPGNHAPHGTIAGIGGLAITAN